jgi:hypothetical protein
VRRISLMHFNAAAVTHDENGHRENIQRSTSNIQRRSQSSVAAIFINNRWVQVLALAIQIGGWIYYFAALQTALSG